MGFKSFKRGLSWIKEPYRRVLAELLKALLEVFGEKLISLVVFGSVARGDARKDSDVDVLIVVENLPKPRFERLDIYMKAERRLDPLLDKLLDEGYAITISPILKTRKEAERVSPLYLDMVEDAVILYDKEEFFEGILRRLKARLEELGAERVWVGKKWYWRLKKDYKFGEVIEL